MHSKRAHAGFTLVEMSVVITIVALVVGGMVIGHSLIRINELRSLMTEVEAIQRAIYGFRQKYNQLPGDFTGAEALWGSDAGCPSTAYNDVLKTETCDGDGNGQLNSTGWGGACGEASTGYMQESFRLWQHLANAKFFGGIYTGVQGSGSSYNGVTGRNIPESSSISRVGFQILNYNGVQPAGGGISFAWFNDAYSYVLLIGHNDDVACFPPYWPFLSAREAYDIDKKFDDGRPGTGILRTYTSTIHANCNDGISATGSTAVYSASDATDAHDCAFVYIPDWF